MTLLMEPGFLVILALGVIVLVQALGAYLARPKFIQMNCMVDELLDDPAATAADRAWIRTLLEMALDRRFPWLVALVAPLVGVYLFIYAVKELREDRSQQLRDNEDTEDRISEGLAEATLATTGHDPRRGAFWSDPRRRHLDDLAFDGQLLSTPFSMAWICLWSLPAIAVLFFVKIGSLRDAVREAQDVLIAACQPIFTKIAAVLDKPGGPDLHGRETAR